MNCSGLERLSGRKRFGESPKKWTGNGRESPVTLESWSGTLEAPVQLLLKMESPLGHT